MRQGNGASSGPGSRASTGPQSPQGLGPPGFDPSRIAGYRLDVAVRMADEISENLRKQVVDLAAIIARDAANPLLARYLSGRTAELHDWAVRLNTWGSIRDSLRRDSDGSPEGGDGEAGSVEDDSAGRQASPVNSLEIDDGD